MTRLIISWTLGIATISCLLIALAIGADSFKFFKVGGKDFSEMLYKVIQVDYLDHEYVDGPTKLASGFLLDDIAKKEYFLDGSEMEAREGNFENYLVNRDSLIEVLWSPEFQSVFPLEGASVDEWISTKRKSILNKLSLVFLIPFATLLYWIYPRVAKFFFGLTLMGVPMLGMTQPIIFDYEIRIEAFEKVSYHYDTLPNLVASIEINQLNQSIVGWFDAYESATTQEELNDLFFDNTQSPKMTANRVAAVNEGRFPDFDVNSYLILASESDTVVFAKFRLKGMDKRESPVGCYMLKLAGDKLKRIERSNFSKFVFGLMLTRNQALRSIYLGNFSASEKLGILEKYLDSGMSLLKYLSAFHEEYTRTGNQINLAPELLEKTNW